MTVTVCVCVHALEDGADKRSNRSTTSPLGSNHRRFLFPPPCSVCAERSHCIFRCFHCSLFLFFVETQCGETWSSGAKKISVCCKKKRRTQVKLCHFLFFFFYQYIELTGEACFVFFSFSPIISSYSCGPSFFFSIAIISQMSVV